MRKAGILISIVGAAAFAALLAWGLSFGSGLAQAQDEATPTPTPTETPTVTPEVTPTPVEYCAPVIPGTYNGAVTINGQPAPDGTSVSALVDGVTWGTVTTSGGRYVVDVPASPPTVPPCFAGGTITFQCDSVPAAESATWSSALHDLDLSCAAPAVTPTPPPVTPTPPPVTPTVPAVTPTPTPTVLPPTGAGGMSDGGFLWWPLALAAAALTSLAGLFTARWARR